MDAGTVDGAVEEDLAGDDTVFVIQVHAEEVLSSGILRQLQSDVRGGITWAGDEVFRSPGTTLEDLQRLVDDRLLVDVRAV